MQSGIAIAIILTNRTERDYDDEEDTTKDSKGKEKAGPSEQKPIPESTLKPEVQVCLLFFFAITFKSSITLFALGFLSPHLQRVYHRRYVVFHELRRQQASSG